MQQPNHAEILIASDPSKADCVAKRPTVEGARGAVSSAVERFVYTEDVGGSIPSLPTILPAGPGDRGSEQPRSTTSVFCPAQINFAPPSSAVGRPG